MVIAAAEQGSLIIEPSQRPIVILASAVVLLLVGSALIALPRWTTSSADLEEWTVEQIDTAREASKGENFLVAIACLTDVLRQNPKNSEALALRGAAYLHLDRTDLAREDTSQAIRLDPNNAEAFQVQALICWGSDRDRALGYFNRAIELSPDNANYCFSRGLFFAETQDHVRALADFDRALKLNPADAEVNVHRGIVKLKLGDLPRAWRDFETAVTSDILDDRNLACAHYYRGQICLSQEDLASAKLEFEKSLALSNAFAEDCRSALKRCDTLRR